MFLGFGEWTIGGRDAAIANPNDRGRLGWLQRIVGDEVAARFQRVVIGEVFVVERRRLHLGHSGPYGGIAVNQTEIAH